MASVSDTRYKQRAVIKFLVAEKESEGNIHKRLCVVYGSCAVDMSTVGRWVQRVKASGSGEKADSHTQHAVPMPCRKGFIMSFTFDLHGAAVSDSHLPCHAHAMLMPCPCAARPSLDGRAAPWP